MDALDFSDLSEEWIAQPRSSDPPEAKDDTSMRSSIRSKIPVPLRRSISGTQHALHEKTASDVNSLRVNNVNEKKSREITADAFSGTVQHHDVKKVTTESGATPEWKKRLLKGNGKSQDLFSPIGLEGVFKPPTVKTQTPQANRTRKTTTASEVLPSSPPVLPGNTSQDSILRSPEDSVQLPPIRAPSQTGPRHGDRRRNPSAVSSNKSALSHERFSPVMWGGKRAGSGLRKPSSRSGPRYVSRESGRSPSSMSDSMLQIPPAREDDEADSMSLPEYSELDSEQLNFDSKFITTKRGGFSRDGSFKTRPLTPSSYQHGPFSSMPASDLPAAPEAPLTPARGLSTLDEESPQRQKSSGSPLKLFDKYDTFTNERLNRRISQFEDVKEEIDSLSEHDTPPTPSPRKGQAARRRQRMSSFGEGELDKFDFTHENDQVAIPKWPGNTNFQDQIGEKSDSGLQDPFQDDGTQIIHDGSMPTQEELDAEEALEFEPVDTEAKRPPSSPRRIPDPKRRRTNDKDPESEEDVSLPRQRPLIRSTSSMAGKKRKDARRGENSSTANPEILAGRDILEPISPFRKLSRAFQHVVGEEDPHFIDVNAATDILANELASLALTVAEDVTQGVRKKSVTTADFFREANIIMQHIRAKAAQRPIQPSNTGPDSHTQTRPSGHQTELFSNDDIDRPASRDGGSPPRKRIPTLDKRVVSHLRKFADSDELGLAINSSFNGLKLQEYAENQDLESFVSDRSDIRILDPPQPRNDTNQDGQYGTGKTDSSNGTNSTIPTASSGGRSKAIIEPHRVSHLIADTMGGMTFDHQRQCWVKRKSHDSETKRTSRLGSEMTEDDPFADIPDLVDDTSKENQDSLKHRLSSRPTTANTNGLSSSGPVADTRATSWSTAQPTHISLTAVERRKEQMIESALLNQGTSAPSQMASHQPRAVTIALSSPPQAPSTPTRSDAEEYVESIETPNDLAWSTEAERIRVRNNLSSSVVRYAPRPLSRIDEMDNSMELARSPSYHQDNLPVELVTPAPRWNNNNLMVPATNQSYASMHLTPLPDFTIHQVDQSLNLDVQYVARREGLNNHGDIEDRFSISIKELVAKIADIEPYEPYWEHMKDLDLSKNGLFTLHMLDEFCTRLESLNVDENELGQFNGAPQTIRMLSARNNCFSDLTAWNHLYNLQYLDVSGNELQSLKGFNDLVHLRELKANNNQIHSLDGITRLDGLLKLSLANNAIGEVDLEGSKLPRLERLDLSDNAITSIIGLETLTSLQSLKLQNNRLLQIEFSRDSEHASLKFLNLANNDLQALDVSNLSGLRDLIIDFNSVRTIQALQRRPNIKRVSWRYQRFEQHENQNSISPIDYGCCIDLRSLNLSGNRLLQFSLPERFLNLERLDLASCGIKVLSTDFGTKVPNLRYLNLNHNALRDIQPLSGIKGLSHLYVGNNRLKDFRQVVDVVCKLGKRLQVLDCRNNPFNVGYYLTPKANTMQIALLGKDAANPAEKDPFNDETFLMPDANTEKDEAYLKQIDFGTSIRRRVYELMLSQQCDRLTKLDGMAMNKGRIENKDKVWKRLIALGIVQATPE